MTTKRNPHVDFMNAKRTALLCLDDPAQYSPSYLQMALDRMIRAIIDMTPPQLGPGEVVESHVDHPQLQAMISARFELVAP